MTIKKVNLRNKFFNKFIIFLFFPLVRSYRTYKSKGNKPLNIIKALFALILLSLVWGMGYLVSVFVIWIIGLNLGIVKAQVPIIGSSMLPSITDNSKVGMRAYNIGSIWGNFLPHIQKGDIVVFENKKDKKNLIKRVIGVSGDKIIIKNGHVYVNDKVVDEPYTLKPQSTYGGTAIKDCQEIQIPQGKFLAMGDNRKRSDDSRNIGLVDLMNLQYILSYSDQSDMKKKWRTLGTNGDSSFLDAKKFVELLNAKRGKEGIKQLNYEEKLNKSAEFRGQAILRYDDISWEATRSGYTMSRAISDAGYWNVVYGEDRVFGYYDAQELIDYLFEFPDSAKFFLNKEYQDIGLSAFTGDLNGCPVQIIVEHLAGYKPPNYSKENIEGWQTNLSSLKQNLPSWENIKNYSETYSSNKVKADRLIEIYRLRILRIGRIVSKMESGQWLSGEENMFIEQDRALYNEQEGIATELNKIRWK